MYIKNGKKSECSGCTACMNICPKDAIQMKEDEEGFKYPEINKEICIDCGACYKICPNIKKVESNTIIEAYGAKHKDDEERITSRSGGVFIALSDYVLNQNGVVYGVEINSNFEVLHNRAENKEQRDKFKGSKYIQSDMSDCIKKVIKDLKDGRTVLFSGTACQVHGVKMSVPEHYQKKLYTCDLICHGVPSPKIFKEFLKYIEKISGKTIKEFNFRDKRFGWESHYETSMFDDGTELTTQYFRNLFLRDNILRPACYKCNYTNTHRPADITIADFWGIENIIPEFKDEIGVSLTLINNEKGKIWFEAIKDNLKVEQCSVEKCIENTYNLRIPTQEVDTRGEFWIDYKEKDFEYIIQKYAK